MNKAIHYLKIDNTPYIQGGRGRAEGGTDKMKVSNPLLFLLPPSTFHPDRVEYIPHF
jgi:hypothetical protein